MNPAVIESLAGPLAIILSLGMPIITIVATLVIILVVARNRHRERMKMVEQGMLPPIRGRTGNFYPLLIIGAIMSALGLAIFLAELFSRKPDFAGGLILGLPGLAMLACFIVVRKLNRNRRSEPNPRLSPPSS